VTHPAVLPSMSAYVVSAPGSGDWATVQTPAPDAHEVLVEVQAVGLCGTDAHLFDGSSPNVRLGLTTYPWRPGHEWSGTIVAVSPEVHDFRPGDRVVGDPFVNCGRCVVCRNHGRAAHCPNRTEIGVRGGRDGALAQYLVVPQANLAGIPETVSFADAVLAEPATTALHALEVAGQKPGSPLAVIGTGTLGLIVAQVALAAGSPVTVIGIDAVGMQAAADAGASIAAPGELEAGTFLSVVEASGATPSLAEAGRLAAVGGRVGLLGFPSSPTVPIDAAGLIVNGVGIQAVLGGIDRMRDALRLIERGIINAASLIDSIHSWDETTTLIEQLGMPRPRPKVILDLAGLSSAGNLVAAGKEAPDD
jgi:2-desacetyl-2-hydroxyethyl bacteriochlorophyllide A dehydrogenase